MSSAKQNIHLVGMPGAGKSTVGKALARALALTFVDADQELIAHTGVPIATIFEVEGEAGFRDRETQILGELCQRQGMLLATGGGVVLREENRRLLKTSGAVIFLNASLDHLWQRTRNDSRRPLLQTDRPRDALRSLLDVRTPLYREVADLVVETGRQSVGRLVQQIIEELHQGKLWPPAVAAEAAATPQLISGARA